MITTMRDVSADTCGGKATALAVLLREGLPVPDGFVVPNALHRIARGDAGLPVPHELRDALAWHLAGMGDPPVAVRSSAANEDTARGSAAGQYESVLAVRGVQAVAEAVRVCWASSSSARATGYWNHLDRHAADGEPDMAVLVQRFIDADASGVMFTPVQPGDGTRIEASWGGFSKPDRSPRRFLRCHRGLPRPGVPPWSARREPTAPSPGSPASCTARRTSLASSRETSRSAPTPTRHGRRCSASPPR